MKDVFHEVDFCVVGGGLAGLCAAVSAARHGVKAALIHDRPVPGGNASSEIRMWPAGARGENNRETGIIEEIILENYYLNPLSNYSIWDSVLYGKTRYQDGIILLCNCSCVGLEMRDNQIASVKAWQLTTETRHTVKAKIFADCSGDSILAPMSGAEFSIGRESSKEFNEDIEPSAADKNTMGLSCLIQARETSSYQKFIPPKWAYKYAKDEDLPNRPHRIDETNYWWIEVGGVNDSIHDTEQIKDDLVKIAFGVWDHIKNHGDHNADNWALDWVGFLPGKRESRRYVGDYILTQNDIRAEGKFDDIVAYGGWPMDDHDPKGFKQPGNPTIFHPAPSPYGIPYRCLYSRNIENLMFAGRNISVTHAALSSTRVMRTCSIIGQAVGTAVSIALRKQTTPRGVYNKHIKELQQILMEDDCYIPWHTRPVPELSRQAELTASQGDPEPLRNGIDRPAGNNDNGWMGKLDSWIQYSFKEPKNIKQVCLIFDSDLNRNNMALRCCYPLDIEPYGVPKTIIKKFKIETQTETGKWETVFSEDNNYQRFVRVSISVCTKAVRFIPQATWGSENAHLFAFDVR
ncbi:MAG: FAD-dependent oxidoreductase [Planctomycetaceae bacterium]|nr:FAD-dependent oxidoreductase [Planctomycetaceae bacterium]